MNKVSKYDRSIGQPDRLTRPTSISKLLTTALLMPFGLMLAVLGVSGCSGSDDNRNAEISTNQDLEQTPGSAQPSAVDIPTNGASDSPSEAIRVAAPDATTDTTTNTNTKTELPAGETSLETDVVTQSEGLSTTAKTEESTGSVPDSDGSAKVDSDSMGDEVSATSAPTGQAEVESPPAKKATPTKSPGLWGASGPLKAVPGAVGGGQDATGGRGGRVLTVNTQKDVSNPNDNLLSLREALNESGPRHIVFEVGGVFEMQSYLEVGGNRGQVTVACQTAPAPGVIIKSETFVMSNGMSHVIMQHCRHRNYDNGVATYGRGIGLGQDTSYIYIDHASVSWATDENSQGYISEKATKPLHHVTFANSIFAEGDADSSHPQSISQRVRDYHSMGPSCNSNSKTGVRPEAYSIVRNFIAHNAKRNGSQYSCEGETASNIIYNWAGQGTDLMNWGGPQNTLFRNNLYKPGPSTHTKKVSGAGLCGANPYRCAVAAGISGTTPYSVQWGKNYFVPENGTADNAQVMAPHPNVPPSVEQNFSWATPIKANVTDMARRESSFIRCVGASVPRRDAIDSRVIEEFFNHSGAVGIYENQRGSTPNSSTQRDYSMYADSRHPSGYDSDRDGMSDAWEQLHKFDVGIDDSSGDHDNDGWTNIEEFFADAARCE